MSEVCAAFSHLSFINLFQYLKKTPIFQSLEVTKNVYLCIINGSSGLNASLGCYSVMKISVVSFETGL